MSCKLSRNRSLLSVPEDLTYFVHNDCYLVINPQNGGRCILNSFEFGVLQALTSPKSSAPFEETDEIDRILAKLVLNWIVYHNGNQPKIEISEPRLRQVYYAITEGCNLRCPYCYASSETRLAGELNTNESLNLVSQVADFGADLMTFTGGEPMLRKDLFQIVKHANQSGLKSNMITNATMIRTPVQAQRIAELFNSVTISVDGGTAEAHDRTRGAGAFAKTVNALHLLNQVGVVPNINHIVTSDNIPELEEFTRFIEGFEVGSVRLMYHNKLGRGVGDGYNFGWEDHLKIMRIKWTSPAAGKLRPDGPKPLKPCAVRGNCGMGGNEIYISSVGDVYPCKLVTGRSHCAGNVRQQSLAEIFDSPLLRSMRKSTVFGGEYHADCSRCYIRASCGGGCRATHMSESLDLRRNSRHQCRILRDGIAAELWLEAGINSLDLYKNDREMTTPRLVVNGKIHPVFDDWKTDSIASSNVAPVGVQRPIADKLFFTYVETGISDQ
jgi:radical SAM protein with 4Fe4S-binding SPASM domain